MKIKVKVKDQAVYVDKKKVNLLSGEVHYWRLDPYLWPDILMRVKDLGLKVIATYICWDFHELENGELDFFGKTNPRRDLVGFLSLLKEMGFWVIIRPGPYIYSEWKNLGVPDHAANYHRLHPEYLKKASLYIKEVSRIIKPFLATNGGNIIFYQPDNEIDPFLYRDSKQLGLFSEGGIYKDFIRSKYKAIAKLNNSWNQHYRSFNEVRADLNLFDKSKRSITKHLDLQEFLNDYVCKCADWVIKEYRKNGIDVPAIINCYTSFKIQPPMELAKRADVVGFDAYPTADFLEYKDEFKNYLEWMRCANFISKIPYIAESESGIWYGRHFEAGGFNANHYRLKDLSALACGIKGFNWYMLVNRDNWQESPITEQNEIRQDIFNVFKSVSTIYNELDIPSLKRTTNVALTFDDQSFHIKTASSDSVLSSVYKADIDFSWYPLSKQLPKEKLLIYANENWLSIEKQRKLYNYVKEGGNLVFFDNACLYDEKLILNNLFGLKEPDGNYGGKDMIYSTNDFFVKLKNEKISIKAPLLCYNNLKGRGIKPFSYNLNNSLNISSKDRDKTEVCYDFYCGCEYKIGKGRVLCLFVKPDAELINAVCRYFKIMLPSQTVSPEVTTTVLKGKDAYYLFVLNNAPNKQTVSVSVDKRILRDVNQAIDLVNKCNETVFDKKNSRITLSLKAKDATVIRLTI